VRHGQRPRWYRSFYWRIAVSLVVFVIVVLAAQGLMFSYLFARANARNPAGSPNNLAAAVAAGVGAALEADPGLDLGAYLAANYAGEPWRIFVVTRDGAVAGATADVLSPEILRSAEATLARTAPGSGGDAAPPRLSGPVVTAPVQVAGELQALVVLPPPPPRGLLGDVGRLLSLPGTILLIVATVAAAGIIFGPARRRLASLEDAAERLGSGNLSARAPEEGGDEIARVARAFNRMAAELAARDEALRTSDRLRRQMLADVSHELKTPLTAMRGFVETLRMAEAARDEDRRARYVDTIERETRRLERIVGDLVDLARYENGVTTLDPRVFDVERMFQHVVQRHEQEAGKRGVRLDLIVTPGADQAVADPDRIEQVVDNLVANALRHTPAGGTITLRASTEPGACVLSVADSGEGIAPEHLPHVFDRFYKVDSARVAGTAGSGLGLSIAKAIVERHGGRLSATSVPGDTRFTLTLPQPDADPAPAAPGPGRAPAVLGPQAHSSSANR
jgi:signal transduction histidine kinase